MRTIPAYIDPGFKNRGERLLFDLLKDIRSETFIAIHSLNLPAHTYKATGEIDFVIIGPRGLYVLEVKGGQISCHDGIWKYEDRWSNYRHSSEGPFAQASSAMYTLRERLKERIPIEELSTIVMGYGVIFPDCRFEIQSVEWDPELIFDGTNWTSFAFDHYLQTLENYWLDKFPNKPRKIDLNVVENLLTAVRPDFDLVRSLNVEAIAIEARLVSMTQEQYARMDMIEHCSRILVEGGAGTGKTFIASALSVRYGAEGKKVLFLCYSPLLAGYLKKQVSSPGVKISSVHQLILETVARLGEVPTGYYPGMPLTDVWYQKKLLPAFQTTAKKMSDSDRYDILILDEAQDILSMEYLSALDQYLIGGVEQGIWRFFYDSCNQAKIFDQSDLDATEYLRSLGPVPPRLIVNCRNTNEIVTQTKLITGADLSNQSTGPGPDVEIQYYKNQIDAAHQVGLYLDSLESQGCQPSEITILSPVQFNLSCLYKLPNRWKNKIYNLRGSIAETFPNPRITFSTITDFKGLENRYILLVDIQESKSVVDIQSLLYVGMTRARVKLWMDIADTFRERIINAINQNLLKLAKGYGYDR